MAYIDKELFKQDIKMRYCNNCARPNEIKCRVCHVDDMLGEIEDAPTADVVEVKHGEWIKTDRGIRKSINTGQPMRVYACDCSCCGYHTGNQGTEFKYCPHCGAKMDGVKEE